MSDLYAFGPPLLNPGEAERGRDREINSCKAVLKRRGFKRIFLMGACIRGQPNAHTLVLNRTEQISHSIVFISCCLWRYFSEFDATEKSIDISRLELKRDR
jgi:hypothetical protein